MRTFIFGFSHNGSDGTVRIDTTDILIAKRFVLSHLPKTSRIWIILGA